MKKYLLLLSILAISYSTKAQNVGINSTGASPDNSAMLDVSATDKGILVPRVSLVSTTDITTVASPANSLLVYNTNASISGTGANGAGYYYWNGSAWKALTNRIISNNFNAIGTQSIVSTEGTTTSTNIVWLDGGNQLLASGGLGTTSNNHINLLSNNIVRGRLTNLGEFFIGATNTVIPGDLMAGVGNTTFPWAVSGYSAFNGSGVYGSITGGSTTFAGVQGDYLGSAGANTAAMRGSNSSNTSGTGFRTLAATGPRVGVIGTTTVGTGSYTFGVHGSMGTADIRSGAVFGDDFGFAMGALGYYAANLTDYSVYGFGQAYQTGTGTGRFASPDSVASTSVAWEGVPNTNIGLGIYGGVMGGWVRGMGYGMHVKGERYSMYVDGISISNQPQIQLIPKEDGTRIPAYTSVSSQNEISIKGKARLESGISFIPFSQEMRSLIQNPNDLIITITPMGNTNGVYISQVTQEGFTVKENNGGTANTTIHWIAIIPLLTDTEIPSEVLSAEYDTRMRTVMRNDNDTQSQIQPIWWDGQQMRFDSPPPKVEKEKLLNTSRTQNEK